MRTLNDLYQEYIVELDPILWEAGKVNGIWVDNEARLELMSTLKKEIRILRDKANEKVPIELNPLKHYKTPPKEEVLAKVHAKGINEIRVPNPDVKTCSSCGAQHITKTEHTGKKGGRGDIPLNRCYKAEIISSPGEDTEYDVILPFNPGSDRQLKSYAQFYHHKLGRDWKTGEDTLDAKQIQKFIDRYGDKHPLYRYALEMKKVRHARSTAKAWIPDEQGKIYGQYKNVPETLRLSQADHNLMNVSHRGNVPYAKELRRLLIAKPGYTLVEGDSSSIEAVISGYLMGSASYMALAKRGIHAAWSLQTLGKEITDENIKWLKNNEDLEIALLYERKKRTVHGVSYGMGAKLLFESYRESFVSVKAAQAEIDDFYKFVPELQEWHENTKRLAYKQGYLQSSWGFKNYYYNVYVYDFKSKLYKPGKDAKAAIAFNPQHGNAMFQRENLKLVHADIGKLGKRGKWFMTAIGYVHDSIGLAVPEDDVDRAKEMLGNIMTRPIKQLGNITIGVGLKCGKNWAEMK